MVDATNVAKTDVYAERGWHPQRSDLRYKFIAKM